MKEKKIGGRVTLYQENNGLTTIIRSPRNIFFVIFLPVWLIGWTFGLVSAISELREGSAPAFFIIWLSGWVVGGVVAIYSWLWSLFGQEIITIKQGYLSTKRDLFGLGRVKSYTVKEIGKLRAAGAYGSPFGFGTHWTLYKGTVAFEWRDKTIRFGSNLREGEAEAVVGEMLPYLAETSNNALNRTRHQQAF